MMKKKHQKLKRTEQAWNEKNKKVKIINFWNKIYGKENRKNILKKDGWKEVKLFKEIMRNILKKI